MEDSHIIELYKKRDEQAIEQTSLKYGTKLNHISLNIVCNPSDAGECENDTYLAAWNLIPPHDPSTYLFSFLAKIIRNISLNCCKRKNAKKRNAVIVELSKEMEECIPAPNDSPCNLTDTELGTILSTFLRTQSKEARNIFLRRYWFADSIMEISERFAMSESKVKSMLFRTRNKLKIFLKEEGYEL